MAKRLALVTIGTDGLSDWVQVPNGQRFLLGPVSVLKLVMGLVPSRTARTALKEFTENNQVMLSVDLDKMWALLPYRRARYSSTTNPLIKREDRRFPTPSERAMIKEASYDTFKSNMELAEGIVTKLDATNDRIDELIKQGKRFDSSRAKGDLHKIACQVSEIAQNVDLAHPWVGNDLTELSNKATEIHDLFHPQAK